MSIRGIGPAFCEKHGESLLATLAALEDSSPGPARDAVPSERPAAAVASQAAPT